MVSLHINTTFTSTIVKLFTGLSLFVISIASKIPRTKKEQWQKIGWYLSESIEKTNIGWYLSHHGPGSMGCSHLSVSISLKSFSTHISSHSSIVLNLLLFPVEQLNNAFATSWGPTHQGNRHIWIVHKFLVLDCNHSGSKNLRRAPAPWVSCKPCQK